MKQHARDPQKRRANFRPKRKYFLIVCEGTKTEPLYFETLKNDLPQGVLQLFEIDIQGFGKNGKGLVHSALKEKKRIQSVTNRPIDQVWVVFDYDDLKTTFEAAIKLCEDHGLACAWSNDAFELWYLLHFDLIESPIPRRQYGEMLESRIQKQTGEPYKYRKNDPGLYKTLKNHGNQTLAIKRVDKLLNSFAGNSNYAAHNPCTRVHLLVQELKSLS